MKTIQTFLTCDKVFTIAFFIALLSCLFGSFQPHDIDWHVICSLFGLMLVIQLMEQANLLAASAQGLIRLSHSERGLISCLVILAFVAAMCLTNDVAILTLMPVYLTIVAHQDAFHSKIRGAILIIMAANLGSALLPFGNPQNLFLFNHYHLTLGQFLEWLVPLMFLAVLLLVGLMVTIPRRPFTPATSDKIRLRPRHVTIALGLLMVMLLAITNVVPLTIAVVVVVSVTLVSDRDVLTKIDYHLLLTFVCFFLIVGNLERTTWLVTIISHLLNNARTVLIGSALLSQVISNVPAAILVANFTGHARAVLLGVNIGGLGTLVASLANLIGFKIFALFLPHLKMRFLRQFLLVNIGGLVILLVLFSLWVH